jgi:hypothetical protein
MYNMRAIILLCALVLAVMAQNSNLIQNLPGLVSLFEQIDTILIYTISNPLPTSVCIPDTSLLARANSFSTGRFTLNNLKKCL